MGRFALSRRHAGALLAAVAGCLAVAAGGPASSANGEVVSAERSGGAHAKQKIEKWWTPARMRRAEPLIATAGPQGARIERRGRDQRSHLPAFESSAVANPLDPAFAMHGKVFGRMRGVGPYECSGTAVNAANRSVLFTAGHCIREPRRAWAKRLVFVPAYAEGSRPLGKWVFHKLLATRAWAKRSNFNFDFGAVVMSPRNGVALEDATGGLPFGSHLPRDQIYRAVGYPANLLDGQRMWECLAEYAGGDPAYQGPGPRPIGIGCDMGVGASGGGWVAGGRLASVSSFGYGRDPVLYGPYFGGKAQRTYQAAAAE